MSVKADTREVLTALRNQGPLSRRDLADWTNLHPERVRSICGELVRQGVLSEVAAYDVENRVDDFMWWAL